MSHFKDLNVPEWVRKHKKIRRKPQSFVKVTFVRTDNIDMPVPLFRLLAALIVLTLSTGCLQNTDVMGTNANLNSSPDNNGGENEEESFGPATKLAFSVQPTNVDVDTAFGSALKVEIRDADDNLVTNANNSVTISLNDPTLVTQVGGTLTVSAVNGVATFPGITLDEIATGFTIDATASGLTSTTSNTFNTTGVMPIYRSVGRGTTAAIEDDNGNSREITISGMRMTLNTVTFDEEDLGVGDIVQYDSTGDDTIDSIAFIYEITDTTNFLEYKVKSSTGGIPNPTTGTSDAWSVCRAYSSFANADAGIENTGCLSGSLSAALRNFDDEGSPDWGGGGKDLTSSNEEWNIAMYADAVDTYGGHFSLSGWTTSPTQKLRWFTPNQSNHSRRSQRHSGYWRNSQAYTISFGFDFGMDIAVDYFELDGIQLESDLESVTRVIETTGALSASSSKVVLSNNIVRPEPSSANTSGNAGIIINGGTIVIANNIVYGFDDPGSACMSVNGNNSVVFFYNNTVMNCSTAGMGKHTGLAPTAPIFAVNNIAQGTGIGYTAGWDASSSNNIAMDSTAPGSGSFNSATVNFVNAEDFDFRLDNSEVNADDQGADLTADVNFAVDKDIRGEAVTSVHHIGAFKYLDYVGSLSSWNELGSGTTDDPYQLFNKDQIKEIGLNACGSGNSSGCSSVFHILDDVDIDNEAYTPIGDPTNMFDGTIDGNGRTISNLTINTPSSDGVGFVGDANCTVTVRDLTFDQVNIDGRHYVGAVVGAAGCSNLNNVRVTNGSVTSSQWGGGLVGLSTSFTLVDSNSRNVDVEATGGYGGGLIGATELGSVTSSWADNPVTGGSHLGGIIGNGGSGGNSLNVIDSYARGNVTGTANNIGGLVGLYSGTGSIMTGSYAVGDVKSTGSYVGGLVGTASAANSIDNSFALGKVTGDDRVGGFAGNTTTDINDSFAMGDVNGSSNYTGGFAGNLSTGNYVGNFATGDVYASGSGSYAGGFAGQSAVSGAGTLEHSYATGNVYASGITCVGGFTGRNSNSTDIRESYAIGNVYGSAHAGGFAGYQSTGSIVRSFATGMVYGNNAGGFIGNLQSQVSESYSLGPVRGSSNTGGFAGVASGNMTDNFAAGTPMGTNSHSFVGGTPTGTLTTNFWDDDETGGLDGTPANDTLPGAYTSLTTSQMADSANFTADFNYTSTWTQIDGKTYPIHKNSPRGRCIDNPLLSSYTFLGGGTFDDPYLICNSRQLEDFVTNGCGTAANGDCDKHLDLGSNIEFNKLEDIQIGSTSNCFSGVFDGNNYSINNYFYDSDVDDRALIACLDGRVQNLKMENYFSESDDIRGSIAATLNGFILNVHVSGRIDTANNTSQGGGLAGYMNSNAVIAHSSFVGTSVGGAEIGGLVGFSTGYSTIMDSEAHARVSSWASDTGLAVGDAGSNNLLNRIWVTGINNHTGGNAGGLVGRDGIVHQSYAGVDVTGATGSAGGFYGTNSDVYNSYAVSNNVSGDNDVAGFGHGGFNFHNYVVSQSITGGTNDGFRSSGNSASWDYNFWDQDTSGITTGGTATKHEPETTANLMLTSTYTGWDFTDIWLIFDTVRRPLLRAHLHPVCANNPDAVDYNDIGSGTHRSPYRICFKEQVMSLAANCGAGGSAACTAHYQLMNNIDMEDDLTFTPIGNNTNRFDGTFNGNGHTISRITIDNAGSSFQGLFGRTNGNTFITNLKLRRVDIEGNTSVGGLVGDLRGKVENVHVSGLVVGNGNSVGGLAGYVGVSSRIRRSSADVDVSINGSGNYVGGLVGSLDAVSAQIILSFATGDVTACGSCYRVGGLVGDSDGIISVSWASGDVSTGLRMGGLVGSVNASSSISSSYALGDVSSGFDVGGLAGDVHGTVTNCYARGNVTGSSNIGGFAGRTGAGTADISYSYSTGAATGAPAGGFIGDAITNGGTFTRNFWNEDTSGINTGAVATQYENLTDANFIIQGSFDTWWNFTDDWKMVPDKYPELRK